VVLIDRLRKTHELPLPNLDPDAGRLQAEVARILRREGIWSQTFRTEAEQVLGSTEEASVFGLIQHLTGAWAKSQGEEMRLARERAAGRVMEIAA